MFVGDVFMFVALQLELEDVTNALSSARLSSCSIPDELCIEGESQTVAVTLPNFITISLLLRSFVFITRIRKIRWEMWFLGNRCLFVS